MVARIGHTCPTSSCGSDWQNVAAKHWYLSLLGRVPIHAIDSVFAQYPRCVSPLVFQPAVGDMITDTITNRKAYVGRWKPDSSNSGGCVQKSRLTYFATSYNASLGIPPRYATYIYCGTMSVTVLVSCTANRGLVGDPLQLSGGGEER